MAGEDHSETVRRAAAQAEQAERLRQDVARLAGAVADTEQQVAATRRDLAQGDPARADDHLAAADDAERFAVHEREEQRRWQQP